MTDEQPVGLEAPPGLAPSPAAPGESPTYYDLPAVKEPVWTWEVPAYFFVGGAAGAAATLGAIARAAGGPSTETLVRDCRRLAAAGGLISTGLLIKDLGRPGRFLNMLRVFKVTSPLNLGSWILSGTTGAALVAAGPAPAGIKDAAGALAGLFGLPQTGYTAVLVSGTAVPVWRAAHRSLPWLFVASAASSAGSLLALGDLSETEHAIVRRLSVTAQLAELVAAIRVQADAGEIERVGRALTEGAAGSLWKASAVLTAASLGLGLVASRRRAGRVAAAALGVLGSLALRYAVVRAGHASARDPRAAFEQQRAAT